MRLPSVFKPWIGRGIASQRTPLVALPEPATFDSGADADAKAFAKDTLPTVKAHLAKIQGIAKKHGVER